MSRLNTFKSIKTQDIIELKKDAKFLAQKRMDKAKEARTNQFDKNREIPDMSTDEPVKPAAIERYQELMEWRKKKEMEKQKRGVSKRPFLPSGPSAVNKNKSNSGPVFTKPQTSKTLHNSLTSNPVSKKKNDNPNTNMRVTRSQLRREREENEIAAATSLPLPSTKPTYVVDEQDLAWIPEKDLGEMNLKVRRKSLRFSEVFADTPRSPFVFKAKQEAERPHHTIPTILEDSVEISPITGPTLINRNLLGAFSLLADDTDIISEPNNSEVHTVGNEAIQNDVALKITKEVQIQDSLIITLAPVIQETDTSTESQLEVPNATGIDLYTSLLQNTKEDMTSQRNRWKATLNTLTEACDSIRCAIGHTDLLLNKKFPQYAGLIQDASDNPGNLDIETRCSDLQGFWDLILREVEDMQAKYGKLIRLAENGYQAVKSTHKLDRKPPRKAVPKPKKESTRLPSVTRGVSNHLREHMLRGREQMKEEQKEPGAVVIVTQQRN